MKKNYVTIINQIANWINNTLVQANAKGFVFGVSGGIDSALITAIAAKFFKEKSIALRLDIFNSKTDIQDANLVVNYFQVNVINVDLENVYQIMISNLPKNNLSQMNLKSRLRMVYLYYYAQVYNYLVCGTSNAAELYTGYFTKYGDSGSDFIPLANLTKNDVRNCAKLLNVPIQIINKAPSAGLSENQTDETDLQVKYSEIDLFLENQSINQISLNRINQLHQGSEHKRNLPKTMLEIGKIIE